MKKHSLLISTVCFLSLFSCTNNDVTNSYKEIDVNEAFTIKENISHLYENEFVFPEDICLFFSMEALETDEDNNEERISANYEFHSVLSQNYFLKKESRSGETGLYSEEYVYYKDDAIIVAHNIQSSSIAYQNYMEHKCSEEEFLPYLEEKGYNINLAPYTVNGMSTDFFEFIDYIYNSEHGIIDDVEFSNDIDSYDLKYKTKGEGSLRIEGNLTITDSTTSENMNVEVLYEIENNLLLIHTYKTSKNNEIIENYNYQFAYGDTDCIKYPDLSIYTKVE